MPLWLTALFGLAGSLVGGGIAREAPLGGRYPESVAPEVRPDEDCVSRGLDDVEPAGLAAPPRSRLPEPRRDREGDGPVQADDLELPSLADGALVDVACQD